MRARVPHAARVTRPMLEAGRSAFVRHSIDLDGAYETRDLDAALRSAFKAMAKKASGRISPVTVPG